MRTLGVWALVAASAMSSTAPHAQNETAAVGLRDLIAGLTPFLKHLEAALREPFAFDLDRSSIALPREAREDGLSTRR